MAPPTHWGILGGGMLGLTLALRMAQGGQRVTLLEAAPELGGLTAGWSLGDVVWDRYYHVITLSDARLRALLAEIGLESEIRWGETRTSYFDGQGLSPLDNVFDYLRLPVIGMLDKARLAATILCASRRSNGRPLEAIPVADWLIRWSGRRTYERVWRPLLRAKLGSNHDKVSAAFIWGVIRRFYGARRGGRQTEMFGTVEGGYPRVLSVLGDVVRTAGVRIDVGRPVQAVRREDDGFAVETPSGPYAFDRVVATFAAPIAARICHGLADRERTLLEGVLYQGVICASLLLRRPLGGAYLTYIADETIPFTAVVEMSSLVDRAQFRGHHLVYVPRYVPADDDWFELDDETIRGRFMAGLVRMFPDLTDDDVLALQISRTRHVVAVPTVGYSSRLPPMATSVPGLFIVNSAHITSGALAVDETVGLANTAAARLLAEAAA